MGKFKAIWTGSGLSALMMFMGGCDSGERIQDPAAALRPAIGAVGTDDSSDFDRELIQAKTGNSDPALSERAVRSVLEKYGVAYPRDYSPAGPVLDEDADGAASIGAAAAKMSFKASSFNPLRRDFTSTGDISTFFYNISLNNGEGLAVAALGNTANVDPFLVVFYNEPIGTPVIQLLKVAAYNDDAGSDNRNSVVTWTNNTGSAKNLVVLAFAYSSATRGLARIVLNTSRASHNLADQKIGGLKQFGATPLPPEPSNCIFQSTQLTLKIPSAVVDFNALVIDTKAMKGGLIRGRNHTLAMPWRVDNPYPSFGLLYGSASGSAQLIQKDAYTCVN